MISGAFFAPVFLHALAVDSGKSGLTKTALIALLGADFIFVGTGFAAWTATFRVEFIVTLALVAVVVLDTLSVNSHVTRIAETPLVALVPIAVLTRLWARFRASTAASRIGLVSATAFMAVVISDTFASHSDESVLAETALSAATAARTIFLVVLTQLIAFPSTLLVDLMFVTFFFALPVRDTLTPHPNEPILAIATFLARRLGAMFVVRVARLLTRPAALFENLIFRALLIVVVLFTAIGALVYFHTETRVWVSGIASFAIAPTWADQRLNIARLSNIFASPLTVRSLSTVQPLFVSAAFVFGLVCG